MALVRLLETCEHGDAREVVTVPQEVADELVASGRAKHIATTRNTAVRGPSETRGG